MAKGLICGRTHFRSYTSAVVRENLLSRLFEPEESAQVLNCSVLIFNFKGSMSSFFSPTV